MTVKLTTLCDNLSGHIGYGAAWGLSILVENRNKVVLWDTGPSDVAAANALRNGVDIGRIDCAAISHGHADHTGGLYDFLRLIGKEIPVVLHPAAFEEKYVQRPDSGSKMNYIGMPHRRKALEDLGAVFAERREPVWIGEDIVLTGEVPMTNDFETVDDNLFVRQGREIVPDGFADDQALAVKTEKGLVVVLGCAHRGMVNTMAYARKIAGVEKIHAVVGGTHLVRADRHRIEKTIAALAQFGVEQIGVSHCTGMPAAMALASHFGDRFFFNFAGRVTEF